MFKSKLRPLAIPQSEHLKLVGALAFLWGNADFDHPPVEHASLVAGIGLHDRGYGYLDASPVMEMREDEWLPITRRGFDMTGSDPVADLIARYHLRRLARGNDSPAAQALSREFDAAIEAQLGENHFSAEMFERIDHITRLCDTLSFSFCFEQPVRGEVPVFPRNDSGAEVGVHYSLEAGKIGVTPWPFSVESITGYILGYRLPDYPARLDPVILPYHVSARNEKAN